MIIILNGNHIQNIGVVVLFMDIKEQMNNWSKKPGEWNRMIITAKGQQIDIELNGKHIVSANLADWTSGTTNPDGTEIPEWLPIPYANMPTKGYIGLQGKHGESNIWFRNIQLKQL